MHEPNAVGIVGITSIILAAVSAHQDLPKFTNKRTENFARQRYWNSKSSNILGHYHSVSQSFRRWHLLQLKRCLKKVDFSLRSRCLVNGWSLYWGALTSLCRERPLPLREASALTSHLTLPTSGPNARMQFKRKTLSTWNIVFNSLAKKAENYCDLIIALCRDEALLGKISEQQRKIQNFSNLLLSRKNIYPNPLFLAEKKFNKSLGENYSFRRWWKASRVAVNCE